MRQTVLHFVANRFPPRWQAMLVAALAVGLLVGLCSGPSILCAMTLPTVADEEPSSKRSETEKDEVSALLSKSRGRALPVLDKHANISQQLPGASSPRRQAPANAGAATKHTRWQTIGAPLRC